MTFAVCNSCAFFAFVLNKPWTNDRKANIAEHLLLFHTSYAWELAFLFPRSCIRYGLVHIHLVVQIDLEWLSLQDISSIINKGITILVFLLLWTSMFFMLNSFYTVLRGVFLWWLRCAIYWWLSTRTKTNFFLMQWTAVSALSWNCEGFLFI